MQTDPDESPEVLLRKAYNRIDEPVVLLEIGLRLLTGRHSEQARAVFELGCATAPDVIEFDLGVGASLMQQSEYELARQHLVQHLVRFPGSPVGYFHLATSLYELDRPEEMLGNLLKSITIAPSNQQALTFFYGYMVEQGDAQVASDALARFGDDLVASGPRLFLSNLALDRGDEAAASGHLDRALRDIQPEDGEAMSEASRLLVKLGRLEECVELLEEEAEDLPFAALLDLGRAYQGVGESDQAAGLMGQLQEMAGTSAQRNALRELETAIRQEA